ncbi:beta strand repeat-containing protein [Mucilaginibacter sp.]|uniref:beta strand repeat-containing protein n=1 Tax=Mucilaginibacter sp. TaxID=1882438 RepID=UPI0035BBB24E
MLWLIGTIAYGQDAPPYGATVISPNFTWYRKIAAGDTSFYGYSNNNWVNFARRNWVTKVIKDSLVTRANLKTDNIFNGKTQFNNAVSLLLNNGTVAGRVGIDPNGNLIKDTIPYLKQSGGTLSGDLILPSSIPTNALSAAPKAYIDNLITGITWKNAVRVKTTANTTLSGLQTIDGVTVAVGNRVLVNNQTDQTKNGIYIVTTGAWTRAEDVDSSDEISTSTVAVTAGTVNKNTQWTYIGLYAPVIGTDDIVFGQISGAGTYTSGPYLNLTGNVFDANLNAFDERYFKSTGGNLHVTGTQRFYGSVQTYGNLNQYNYDGGNSLNIVGLNGTSQYSIINMDNGVGNGLGIFHGNYASSTGGIILRDSVLKTIGGARFLTTQDFNYTPANPANYYDKTTSDGRYAIMTANNRFTAQQFIKSGNSITFFDSSDILNSSITEQTDNYLHFAGGAGVYLEANLVVAQSASFDGNTNFGGVSNVFGQGRRLSFQDASSNPAINYSIGNLNNNLTITHTSNSQGVIINNKNISDSDGILFAKTTDITTTGDIRYLRLTGGTLTGTLNGAAAYFSGQVGAQTLALSPYVDALIPGQIAAGDAIKFGTINNGPFAGAYTYVNGSPEFRAGRAPGGATYTIGQYVSGAWVSYLDAGSTGVALPKGFASSSASTITAASTGSAFAVNQTSTGVIASFQSAGSDVARIQTNGYLYGKGIIDIGGSQNGFFGVGTATAGNGITRAIADNITTLVVNNNNATATGDIQAWQFNSSTVGRISQSGTFYGVGINNNAASNNAAITVATSGTTISRNIADANPAAVINNLLGTGDILRAQQNSVNKFVVDLNGKGTFAGDVIAANAYSGRIGIGIASNVGALLQISPGTFTTSGNFGTPGMGISQGNITYTSTTSSGTVANTYINAYATATLNSTTATTITKGYGNWFTGPVGNANVTLGQSIAVGMSGDFEVNGSGYITNRLALGKSTVPGAVLDIDPIAFNTSNNFGTTGFGIRTGVNTYNTTAAATTSGTPVSIGAVHAFNIPTMAATNTQYITNGATVYISGAPTAGANMNLGAAWSMFVNSGNTYFGGGIYSAPPAYSTGGIMHLGRNTTTGRLETMPDMIAFNNTATSLNASTLNSTYPAAPLGYQVICGNISTGAAIYTKYSSAVWLTSAATIQQ